MKKPLALEGLVATKGQASPMTGVDTRSATTAEESDLNNMPLNFKVSADFRRRFKTLAAKKDMKLSELLRVAFDEYEQRNG